MSTLVWGPRVWLRVGMGSGKCLMRRAAWCLTRPPRLQVWTDVRMGRDPPEAVKRRCAGREFEWARQRMWHHARHEDQFPHRICIGESPSRAGGRQDGTAAGGSRRVQPSPSREAGLGVGVGVAAGRKRGVESEGKGGGAGHVTYLSLHTASGVVTDQEVACSRTRHVTVAADNPGSNKELEQEQEPGRKTLGETAGR